MKNIRNKKLLTGAIVLALVLLLACLVCMGLYFRNAELLPDQKAWQRWQGDNETAFAQISCFLPGNETLTREQIYDFRNSMYNKLKEASLEVGGDERLFTDAWSCKGSAKAANYQRSANLSVIAVGGDFFTFHPVRLISGNYLSESDIMKDRVLLDEESAWILFGGTELEGMSFYIEGVPVTVAGVFARETDGFSKKAHDGNAGIYMNYDTYCAIKDTSVPVSCYEFLMADPVKNFVSNAAKEKFPIKGAEILDNSRRYKSEKIFALIKELSTRSMRTDNVVYPYWENAARLSEEANARLLSAAIGLAVLPGLLLAAAIFLAARCTIRKLDEDIIPSARERTEEAIRVAQRKRWEKKHNKTSD